MCIFILALVVYSSAVSPKIISAQFYANNDESNDTSDSALDNSDGAQIVLLSQKLNDDFGYNDIGFLF